eukprot:CAMPEP_0177673022 /NCGR_PEP_ID=MMETSP0447-20121125/25691_1 /TAXON_ID=0 /ORGANISM="Stygamoeba regulata, Strain BSH-02190019" /LENGTH=291 /DNA_ID=CAMNT_0019180805 /DNA_START=12 /DNA_END=887 /DNA_ORIENTATION=-
MGFGEELKSFLKGGFGGMSLVLAGHPLDLIKVRLQTSATGQYKGTLDCARQTIAKEGFAGLYKGMSAPLVGITPIFAVCFWGYELGKKIAAAAGGNTTADLTMGQIMFAGGFSALPTTALMAPGERIKCVLQTQSANLQPGEKPKYSGTIDCAKGILKEGGVRSLFRGSVATLVRDVPGSVAYFGGYELFKGLLSGGSTELNPLAVVTAGGLAGMCNWAVAIPADVLKSRLQTAPEGKYTGIADVFRQLMKNEGPQALFRGIGPAMLRAFPANAACFLGAEVSLKVMNMLW